MKIRNDVIAICTLTGELVNEDLEVVGEIENEEVIYFDEEERQ